MVFLHKKHITILFLFCVFIFISCSKDSDEPNPSETTVTTQDLSITIDENPTTGQVIGVVSGTTNEGTVTFSITEQNPAGAFSIDSASGELKVDDETIFDFETNPTITGTVKVANGAIFEYATVTITLNDVNEDNIFEGSIVLFTQEEVNNFGANNYTHITGYLSIGKIDNSLSTINDLTPLETLKNVGRHLNIIDNPQLNSLMGLGNLEFIGAYLLIEDNPSLLNIESLRKLTSINDYLYINNNDQLTNLNGLENIISINGDLGINSNEILREINSLQNLTSIGKKLMFQNNPNLMDFNLSSLTGIAERLDIRYCPNITNLNSLSNLQTIGTDIYLWSNFGLSDFCGLQNVLINNGLGGDYTAYGNSYNPTKQDIIDGNCSL